MSDHHATDPLTALRQSFLSEHMDAAQTMEELGDAIRVETRRIDAFLPDADASRKC